MMTEEKQANETESQAKKSSALSYGMIFELETVALPGRKLHYQILEGVLKKLKSKLTPSLFVKYALCAPPAVYLPLLLEELNIENESAEQLASQISEEYVQSLFNNTSSLNPGLKTLIMECKKENIVIGALSSLAEEKAAELLQKAGLGDMDIQVFAYDEVEREFPKVDAWLKTARELEMKTRQLFAVVSSKQACKSALTADYQCVAVPDEYTGFEDFGGANMVLENISDVSSQEILNSCCVK